MNKINVSVSDSSESSLPEEKSKKASIKKGSDVNGSNYTKRFFTALKNDGQRVTSVTGQAILSTAQKVSSPVKKNVLIPIKSASVTGLKKAGNKIKNVSSKALNAIGASSNKVARKIVGKAVDKAKQKTNKLLQDITTQARQNIRLKVKTSIKIAKQKMKKMITSFDLLFFKFCEKIAKKSLTAAIVMSLIFGIVLSVLCLILKFILLDIVQATVILLYIFAAVLFLRFGYLFVINHNKLKPLTVPLESRLSRDIVLEMEDVKEFVIHNGQEINGLKKCLESVSIEQTEDDLSINISISESVEKESVLGVITDMAKEGKKIFEDDVNEFKAKSVFFFSNVNIGNDQFD